MEEVEAEEREGEGVKCGEDDDEEVTSSMDLCSEEEDEVEEEEEWREEADVRSAAEWGGMQQVKHAKRRRIALSYKRYLCVCTYVRERVRKCVCEHIRAEVFCERNRR